MIKANMLLFVLCLLCLSCLFALVSASFTPVDNVLINCGGNSSFKLSDGRIFEPDIGNSNIKFSSTSHIVFEEGSRESSLYKSARVFKTSSIYIIKTNQADRHWLRVHFYPVRNSEYDLKQALFSVVANGVTLLHGFSFSRSGMTSGFFKEYVIEVGGKRSKNLVLTLSPWHDSVAFINGIEVVSLPNGQFPSSAVPVPLGYEVRISNDVVFETVHRINMGGPVLTPKNDSLGRIWHPDRPFLLNAAAARNVTVNPSSVKYPEGGALVEIAPNWVYATAQQMADANVANQRFNISWRFNVESGFTYFIRMHFCDIVSIALNDLMFNVYVNNQSALYSFDMSSKTMELSAAFYVDFVANVSEGVDYILLQIGPSNLRDFPSNAILNGLEIMKMSNRINSLDGNLHSSDMNVRASKNKKWVVLAILYSSAGFAALLVILGVLFFCLRRPKNEKKDPPVWMPVPAFVGHFSSKISMGSFPSTALSHSLGRPLTFSEVCEATRNFDESLLLGVGGFGKVYQGVLENGTVVAIKRGNPKSQQGFTEFWTEIEMLSKLRHRHLVSLIGYCEELNEMILVYEFMAGGPLRKHLYGSNAPTLSWKQRLEICIGAAKGLHYLHTGAAEVIIHRDVKTTNILLDVNLTAKVADFGLSKLGPTLDQTHVSTAVKGSFGYLDPEYFRRQQLTEKSDVYSFGVVMLEVLCARPAINPALPREQVNIGEWAMFWQKRGQLQKIIDPHLSGSLNLESLRKFGETAEKCLAEQGTDRPSMGDVLWNLEYALQLHEASTQTDSAGNSAISIATISECIPGIESVDGDDALDDEEMYPTTSNLVFSQLINPGGR